MKKVWKWIFGVLVVLVVLAGMIGLGFVIRNVVVSRSFVVREFPGGRIWNGPMMDGGVPRFGMGVRFFSPLRMVAAFSGWLIPLALLGLLFYGAFHLGKKQGSPVLTAPVAPASATAAAPVMSRTCGKCGQPIQDDWKNCPYCGEKL